MLCEAVAAALCLPDGTVTHLAAAVAHDLPILATAEAVPCLTLPPGFRIAVAGVHLHRAVLPGWQFSRHHVAVSSVARTVLDVSREHGLASGLVIADAAAHRGQLCRADLERVQATPRGRGSAPHNRQLIELLEPRTESPLETLSRLELRNFGPAPEPQVDLWSTDGRHLARVDFYWRELGLVGEADGRSKYDSEAALWNEKLRQDRLTALGLVVIRWSWADAVCPARLREIVLRGMYQARVLRESGVHPRAVTTPALRNALRNAG
ncbi:MAG TPA: hypothetical protein VGH11_16875 [Jatrophihabitans sp.]